MPEDKGGALKVIDTSLQDDTDASAVSTFTPPVVEPKPDPVTVICVSEKNALMKKI